MNEKEPIPGWTCPTCGGHSYTGFEVPVYLYYCNGCSVVFRDPKLYDHNHPGTPNDVNAGYKTGQS